MFDSPIVANGDVGMTFGGKPEATRFYVSSNSFWSANGVVDSRPDFQQKPGGAESYTQLRIGDVLLSVPALAGGHTKPTRISRGRRSTPRTPPQRAQ